jgi:hypothetical protein
MTKRQILINSIRCKRCLDIIESKLVHDCIYCSCGAVAVDGGIEYLKRIGSLKDIEELSKWTEDQY